MKSKRQTFLPSHSLDNQPSLSHHRLKVWHKARNFLRLVQQIPIADTQLRDHASRAVRSVALNIAEGASSRAGAKRRYYEIARASCGEVVAAYELAFDLGKSLPVEQVQMTGSEIATMLTALIR